MNTTTQDSSNDTPGAKTTFATMPPESGAEQMQSRLEAIADREGKY